MNEFTLLTEEQVSEFDYEKKLDILKKYGTRAAITDFSILLGSYVSSNVYTSEENTLKNKEKIFEAREFEKKYISKIINY